MQRPRIAYGTFLAPNSVPRRFKCRCVSKAPVAAARSASPSTATRRTPSAMLLLDLPQERGWRRIRDQHHGPSRHFSRADTLKVKGKRALGVWNAPIDGHKGSADRHYCTAARRSGSVMSNGLSWCTRLPRRSIQSYPRRLPACIYCCAIKRAGSNRRSAPMTTASTAIPNCRSRTGTKSTTCGSNDGALRKQMVDRDCDVAGASHIASPAAKRRPDSKSSRCSAFRR